MASNNIDGFADGAVVKRKGSVATLVKKLFGVPNERGGLSWVDECPDYIKAVSHNPDHALVVRYKEARSGATKKALSLYSITVQSSELKDLIRQVFRSYPGEAVDEEEPSFEAPYHPFLHRWATLTQELDNSIHRGATGRRDQIGALLNVVNEELDDSIRDAQNLARNGNITFRLLWTLFPPGCPVIGHWKDKEHCFLVNEAKYLMAEIEPVLSLELLLLDRDGARFGWRKMPMFIQAFPGSMKITALPAVPLQFHEHPASVLDMLSARGSLASDLMRGPPVYRSYEGPVRLQRNFDLEEVEVFVDGRIILDAKSHSQQAQRYCPTVYTIPYKLECLLSRDSDTKIANMSENDSRTHGLLSVMDNLNRHPVLSLGPTPLKKMTPSINDQSPLKQHRWTEVLFGIRPEAFCRSVVRGYCLTSKAWAEFEIDDIAQIRWNQGAFDALVMSAARKRLLEALVKQQQDHKSDADVDDVVQGKGQGLIMLLTGPPGTGKTLTAESIADRLQLPLYAVSASELGDNAKEIEEQFGRVLRLAASWNAVLLLDEADAFLEKRVDSPDARERNKRVAAFLRILEYYKGILILTTHRFVKFDDAFYSRIHLRLPFKPLDAKARESIWKNFVRGAAISASDLAEFASEELNGRQIKNVMKMSRLLARDSGAALSSDHIRDVLNVMGEDLDTQ